MCLCVLHLVVSQSLSISNNSKKNPDGARPHQSILCQKYLAARAGLRFWTKKQWPGSSPDLSPVKGMWDLLQDHVTPPGCMYSIYLKTNITLEFVSGFSWITASYVVKGLEGCPHVLNSLLLLISRHFATLKVLGSEILLEFLFYLFLFF